MALTRGSRVRASTVPLLASLHFASAPCKHLPGSCFDTASPRGNPNLGVLLSDYPGVQRGEASVISLDSDTC
ncbi:hypothetical protein P167DRAFT_539940 [Morchella conica CCBAS932]|uniref:Uncharacterized protein n=1 Tax=Morchella conica CCBAS932 TaxID=1392247 RepID=A0A3N4KAZ4_9PEZI|nr:hypothetical protein P167DRAFT_539940 [Morchella conica CCBAS932]